MVKITYLFLFVVQGVRLELNEKPGVMHTGFLRVICGVFTILKVLHADLFLRR